MTKVAPEPPNDDAVVYRAINGETAALMQHVHCLGNQERDDSVDEPWEVDKSLWWRDLYVISTSVLWLMPKLLAFSIPVFLLLSRLGGCLGSVVEGPAGVTISG
eukprot:TRINITY_DN30419_c0_g1_i2.p1 TRINITY_DN30419_c0_g1~~TRINITY_DN30419_c0_g1_i2.p1  ORF type:complete len:104 (-),score=8.87 TRINITY_DN30419_c0_g1_i2:176-487(-)